MKEFNVKCSNAFERYLALDKHERVPLSLMIHLVFCPVCRAAVRQMAAAEYLLSHSLAPRPSRSVLPEDPVLTSALEKITAGLFLAGGFALFPFTASGVWMQAEFGKALIVPFYILCGCAVTAYGGLFIGTNIDLFLKRFKTLTSEF